MRLAGAGNSLRPLLQTAAGNIEMVGGEGRLRGKLLELWGGNLMQILNPVDWKQGGDTELNCVAGRFQVGDGIARSDMLLLDSRKVTVAGELVLDIKTEAINGLFKPQPKQASLVNLGEPLQLSGTLKTPTVRPADRAIVSLGKLAIGVAQPAALIVMFGDLGAKEKNPCAALLAKHAAGARPDAGGRE
jgi:AsmA family protein